MAAKQRRMPIDEIRGYEAADEVQVKEYFTKTLTQEQLADKFIEFIRSWRDTERVANAAWRIRDEYQRAWLEGARVYAAQNGLPEPKEKDVVPPWGVDAASYQRLVDALQTYAPMNFPPTQYVFDYAVQMLAGVHDTIARFSTVPEAMAWISEYTNRLRNARWHQGGNG